MRRFAIEVAVVTALQALLVVFTWLAGGWIDLGRPGLWLPSQLVILALFSAMALVMRGVHRIRVLIPASLLCALLASVSAFAVTLAVLVVASGVPGAGEAWNVVLLDAQVSPWFRPGSALLLAIIVVVAARITAAIVNRSGERVLESPGTATEASI